MVVHALLPLVQGQAMLLLAALLQQLALPALPQRALSHVEISEIYFGEVVSYASEQAFQDGYADLG